MIAGGVCPAHWLRCLLGRSVLSSTRGEQTTGALDATATARIRASATLQDAAMRLRWRLGAVLYFCRRAWRRSAATLHTIPAKIARSAACARSPGAVAGQVVTSDEMGGEKERDWRAQEDAQTGSPAVANLPAWEQSLKQPVWP